MATHSRILAWRIPWTVQSWGREGLGTMKDIKEQITVIRQEK